MIFYVIPYLFVLTLSSVLYKVRMEDIPKGVLLFLLVLPATLVAVLRGDVGIDTLNYLGYFNDLRQNTNYYKPYEPGFHLLLTIIESFGFNDRASIAIVSLLTVITFSISFSKTKKQFLLFCWVIFPLYFVDMTMNGLRYGLGFSLGSLAVKYIYEKKYLLAALFCILSISMQYSSFLLVLPFVFINLNKKYSIFLGLLLVLAVVALATSAPLLLQYFYDKQDAYKDLSAPGITSGLVPLLTFFIIYSSYLTFAKKGNSKIIHILLFLEIVSFGIAKITYAGLRLQTLFLFSLLIFIKENFELIKSQTKFFYILFIVGLMSFISLMKNLSTTVEGVESPMIPYKFFWEKQ